jgi:putative tributyrin esterase
MITAVVEMMSRSLGHHVSYSAIIPDAKEVGPGPYPVLYQLHGASDSHEAWLLRSNLVRHVAKIPMIVVCPDGVLSFWLNSGARMRYEDFLMIDLPEHLMNTFNIRPGKAAIGGLSMGGYGALRLGLKYPDRFASVWGHSSALWSTEELRNGRLRDYILELSAETQTKLLAAADIYALAEQVDPQKSPVIGFDCGTEDFLITENRRFHAHLEMLGIAHTYLEHPGAHTWDYWDTHVQEALAQHVKVLGLA